MTHRVRLFIGVALLPLALFAFLPLVSSGQQKNLGSKIERKKDQIAWRKGRERVLSSDVAGFTRRINALQGDITVLQTKQVRLQANLDRKRAELARIQEDLRRERLRLARLRARLAEARAALSKRLVELYKADQPDLVTVVLESNGFADLLERTEFMQRVSDQDARIIDVVVEAKADATATAKRLDKLEKRAKVIANEIEGQVVQVMNVKNQLVDRRGRYADARSDKSALLAGHARGPPFARGRPARARGRAGEGARRPAGLRDQRRLGARRPGPAGLGRLAGRSTRPISSRFGMRWGRLHAGVDIAGARGHADPRRRQRPRGDARLDGRLRQLHLHPARGLAVHVLRAPVALRRRPSARVGLEGPGHRLQRQHGPLDRSDHLHFEIRVGGNAGEPDGLPVGAPWSWA